MEIEKYGAKKVNVYYDVLETDNKDNPTKILIGRTSSRPSARTERWSRKNSEKSCKSPA